VDDDYDAVWKPEKKEIKFDALQIDTKGWKFNREECYEERYQRIISKLSDKPKPMSISDRGEQ